MAARASSYGGERAKDIFLEPHVGGRFFERFVDGDELQVGSVIACDPPDRIVFTWHTADSEGETEVEVTFTPTGEGTRVRLEHRGFERIGSLGPDVANKFRGGWPGVMHAFASKLNRQILKPMSIFGLAVVVLVSAATLHGANDPSLPLEV